MYHHLHHFLSFKDFSEIFYNFTVGLGALGGIFAAYRVFSEWLAGKRKQEKIIRLREIYPPSELGKGYKIADSQTHRGKIYLIDLRTHKKYWIQSSSTFVDLGFDWGKVEHLPLHEFDSFTEEEPILTSGTPWS